MGHTTAQHTFCPIPSGHIRSAVWVSDRHDHKFFPIFFLKQVGLAPVATNFVMAATPLAVAAVAAGSPRLANLIGEASVYGCWIICRVGCIFTMHIVVPCTSPCTKSLDVDGQYKQRYSQLHDTGLML